MRTFAFLAMALLISTGAVSQTFDFNDPESVAAAAVAASPAVRLLDARVDAARESITLADAQPNPMAMGGVQNLEQNLSNDPMMTMYMVGASQTFIPKERRRARVSAAEAQVASLESQRESIAAEIARDAVVAWIDLGSIDARTTVVEDVIALTDSMVAAARARYESGSASQSDVVRAQLAQSDLRHRLISLRGERTATVATLLSLLGLPHSTEVPRIVASPADSFLAVAEPTFDGHAAVAGLRAAADAATAQIELARAARKPEWGIEGSWSYRPEADGMISVLARVELPIRDDSRIEPAIRQAIAEREVALRAIEELERSLRERAAIARSARDEAAEQIRFHQEVLVPQARLAFDSTLAAYQTARVQFEALLGVETDYLRLALDYHSFLARARKAAADLEALSRGARTISVSPQPMTTTTQPSASSASSGAAMGM